MASLGDRLGTPCKLLIMCLDERSGLCNGCAQQCSIPMRFTDTPMELSMSDTVSRTGGCSIGTYCAVSCRYMYIHKAMPVAKDGLQIIEDAIRHLLFAAAL